MALIGSSTAEHALHDSTEVAKNYGFVPNITGNFEGRLREDSADTTFFVLAGVYYPEDIKLAKTTGSLNTTQLRIIYTATRR